MLQLLVENETSARASIPVRWCISPEDMRTLKENNYSEPYILLVVIHRGEKFHQEIRQQRKLVPLSNMMEWINFDRPGNHTIFGLVIDMPNNKRGFRNTKNFYLHPDYSGKYIFVHNEDNDDLIDGIDEICLHHKNDNIGVCSIDVTIAKGFFAKEPPKWLSNWVNFWYETKPRDECQFRRRMILAFTLQPFLVPIWGLLKITVRFFVMLWWMLLATRGINFTAVFRPFKLDLSDVTWDISKSILAFDKNGEKRPAFWLPFLPIFPVVLFLIGFFTEYGFTKKFHFLKPLEFAVIVPMATSLFIEGILFSSKKLELLFFALEKKRLTREQNGQPSLIQKIKLGLEKFAEMFPKKDEDAEERKETEKFFEQYEPLLCVYAKEKPISVSSLPTSRQTVHLRFLDLKAKVCKQFANSGR